MTSFISNVVFVLILDLVHQAEKTCVDKNVFSYKLSWYDPDSSSSLFYIYDPDSSIPRHCLIYMILILPRHCLINDPDSSSLLSYIWSWFFPVTVFYMILILPRHCLIYDPDSSPSLFYIYDPDSSIPRHCIIYMILLLPPLSCLCSRPFPVTSLSCIWSRFFPVTVLYMILILPRHCLIAWRGRIGSIYKTDGEESG
jgi:hypothetical protein